MNGLNLLIQVVLALTFLHLTLHAASNAFFNLENVKLSLNLCKKLLKPLAHGENLKDSLLFLELHGEVSSDGVGKTAWLFHAYQAV